MATTPAQPQVIDIRKTVICQDGNVVGKVVIKEGTVVHIKSNIVAENGDIEIGENNIIEEQATIINKYVHTHRVSMLHVRP